MSIVENSQHDIRLWEIIYFTYRGIASQCVVVICRRRRVMQFHLMLCYRPTFIERPLTSSRSTCFLCMHLSKVTGTAIQHQHPTAEIRNGTSLYRHIGLYIDFQCFDCPFINKKFKHKHVVILSVIKIPYHFVSSQLTTANV